MGSKSKRNQFTVLNERGRKERGREKERKEGRKGGREGGRKRKGRRMKANGSLYCKIPAGTLCTDIKTASLPFCNKEFPDHTLPWQRLHYISTT